MHHDDHHAHHHAHHVGIYDHAHQIGGDRAAAYAMAVPVAITTSPYGVTTVPLLIEKRGDIFAFPCNYTLTLRDKMSEAEFRYIIEELNRTAKAHGPRLGALFTFLVMCPCTGLCTILSARNQFENMALALEMTCHELNKHYQGRINLRITSGYGIGSRHAQTIRVDMEVL